MVCVLVLLSDMVWDIQSGGRGRGTSYTPLPLVLPGEQCNARLRVRAFTYNIARRHPYMQRQDGLIHYSLVYNKFQCKSCKYDLWKFCFDTFSISPHPCLSVVEVCVYVCVYVGV